MHVRCNIEMINEEFRQMVFSKLTDLEREKRKLQIIPANDEKVRQIENEQKTLELIYNYPLSFASNNASDDEIEYIINGYKAEVEMELEQVNQEINRKIEEWTDERFLNEVAAYTILNLINSNSDYSFNMYINLLREKYNKQHGKLYSLENINQIIREKIPNFPWISANLNFKEARNTEDLKNFKSKFDEKVIYYYEKYVAKCKKLSLPFSENIRVMLFESIEPLLGKKKNLEEELKKYKDIDLNDRIKRKRYLIEIAAKTYRTRIQQLPLYASYDLDKLSKLIEVIKKINNIGDKKQLFDAIKAYKEQIDAKSQYEEESKYRAKYQSKYERFSEIYKMLHMGDYSEGDFSDNFAVFLYHTLNKNGIPLCDTCSYIDGLTIQLFNQNDKLIKEVEQAVKKHIDESGIRERIAKYTKLKKSIFPQKEQIKNLEKEIGDICHNIVMSIRNSYSKEGYQLFKELPFLEFEKSALVAEQVDIEEFVEKNNNHLFNYNYVLVTNRKSDLFDTRNVSNENLDDKIQKIQMSISQMFSKDITADEILLLSELTIQELEQVTAENALYEMQMVREIMVQYNSLADKTLINDDYRRETPKL